MWYLIVYWALSKVDRILLLIENRICWLTDEKAEDVALHLIRPFYTSINEPNFPYSLAFCKPILQILSNRWVNCFILIYFQRFCMLFLTEPNTDVDRNVNNTFPAFIIAFK